MAWAEGAKEAAPRARKVGQAAVALRVPPERPGEPSARAGRRGRQLGLPAPQAGLPAPQVELLAPQAATELPPGLRSITSSRTGPVRRPITPITTVACTSWAT